MTSMTGYSVASSTKSGVTAEVAIKSVNSKTLDINIHLPQSLIQYEQEYRARIANTLVRGTVDVSIKVACESGENKVTPNIPLAESYFAAEMMTRTAIQQDFKVDFDKQNISHLLDLVLQRNDVLLVQDAIDTEKCKMVVDSTFMDALQKIIVDRDREGAFLLADIQTKVAKLQEIHKEIESWQPKMEALFRDTLLQKFEEVKTFLGSTSAVDDSRITTEIAVMLVRYTINEEVVRLGSHIAAVESLLSKQEPCGRKLDFFCQEILRELNTIASKSQFAALSQLVVTGKDILEGMREQSKNVV